jgi:hypothetical protein
LGTPHLPKAITLAHRAAPHDPLRQHYRIESAIPTCNPNQDWPRIAPEE